MHKYQILDIIDQGAYGIVWKAVNKQTQQLDQQQSTKKTIQRQIKMLKMLKSNHVVGIRQAFKKKGKIYLIFEFFPQNLLNLIQVDNQGLNIVKCLRFLHHKNVIHRDIKPENILLSEDNQVLKLCDFGFARFIPQNIKQMTDYVATRWYRSPQLLVGEPYQKPSDMFALGCIIGELVDGQPMFPGEDEVDQLYQLRRAIGQITTKQQQYMLKNDKFTNIQLGEIKKKQPLQQRYLGKIQKNALLFMKQCLKMNAQQRLTADQALRHPYIIQLSRMNNDFDNDEQNLMEQISDGRKTVVRNVGNNSNHHSQYHNQMRGSIVSDILQDDHINNINDSRLVLGQDIGLMMMKSKSVVGNSNSNNNKGYQNISNQQHNHNLLLLKGSYGSVDYSMMSKIHGNNNYNNNNNNNDVNFRQYNSNNNKQTNHYQSNTNTNQILNKKSSHQVFAKQLSPSKDYKDNNNNNLNKNKKILKKNMSEQKNIKLNLDVNVNINLKFNNNNNNKQQRPQKQKQLIKQTTSKKFLHGQKDFYNIDNNDTLLLNKLPQLKPKGFMNRKKDDLLFGLSRRIGDRNNLSINGQSKQITKTLIGKKLQGLSVH